MKKSSIIARQAMIAAMYTVVGLVLAPITFGTVQARVSEALTLMPVFGIANIWGVTIGCFLTNLIGFFTGANILGSLDIIFGTLATFTAALASYRLRNIRFKGLPIASAIPPIIFNAVVVGMELCVMISGGFNMPVFIAQAVSVGLGQTVSCLVLGLILVKVIQSNPRLKEIVEG